MPQGGPRYNRDPGRPETRGRRAMAWACGLALALAACGDDSPTFPGSGFGDVRVLLETSGGDVDLDGYIVTLDGVDIGPIASDGSLKLAALPSGLHTIGLKGVAPNCEVEGGNPRSLPLPPGRISEIRFSVTCLPTGIQVWVQQSGADLDPDGFTITVDGSPPQAIQPSQYHVVSRLEPGTHTVAIGGLASNCDVTGDASIVVGVAPGPLLPVHFTVICQPVTGTIEVVVVTSGEDVDPDGYQARVDGGAAHAVASNGRTLVPGLASGDRSVRLESISGNCVIQGDHERLATVTAGAVTTVTFQLTCARADMIAFVQDTDVAGKIHLVHSDGSTVAFLVEGSDPAWSPDGRQVAYVRYTCGYGSVYYWGSYCYVLGLFATRLDAVGPLQLTDQPDGSPDWSPDGAKIAFTRLAGARSIIHVMGADGTGVTPLVIPGFEDSAYDVAWSPDGTRFAFQCQGPTYVDICVVNVDGSNFRRLLGDAAFDGHPAWNPDGTRIAFTTTGNRVGHYRIALIDVDGSNFQEFADGQQPSWSPDGSRLVFRGEGLGTSGLPPGLYLVNADGSGLVRLTSNANDYAPAWRR